MAGTPPRLTADPGVPLSRVKLKTNYADVRRPANAPSKNPIDLVAFGRALDASLRGDTEYYLTDRSIHGAPAIWIGSQLAAFVRPRGEPLSGLLRCLESVEAVDLSAGFDQLRVLLPEEPSLAVELIFELRTDAGLTDIGVAAILAHGALEQYYRGNASHHAKRRFDVHRELIRAATGVEATVVNPEEIIAGGLRVWEAWQGVTALESVLGLGTIAEDFGRRRDSCGLGLLFGAVAIIETSLQGADQGRGQAAIEALVAYSVEHRGQRAEALIQILDEADKAASHPSGPPVRSEAATDPDFLPTRPLPRDLRARLLAPEATQPVGPRRQSAAILIEEIASIVERYEVLIVGDDNSLLFRIAPMLWRSFLGLYQELAAEQPSLETSLYRDPSEVDDRLRREVLALRVLVARAVEIERRFAQVEERRNSAPVPERESARPSEAPTTPPAPPAPTLPVAKTPALASNGPKSSPRNLQAHADSLLLVLGARGLEPPATLLEAIAKTESQDVLRRWISRAATATSLSEIFADQ